MAYVTVVDHSMKIRVPPTPDELSLCSDEVRRVFQGTGYAIGTPTMMQLSLDVRQLTAAVAKLEETMRRQRG